MKYDNIFIFFMKLILKINHIILYLLIINSSLGVYQMSTLIYVYLPLKFDL